MVLSFSGNAFLAHRAARRALTARGFKQSEIHELAEGMSAADVLHLGGQAGLFGQSALLLDIDAAFKGASATKARNEVLAALENLPTESLAVVIDLGATAARQKRYKALGEYQHCENPRFNALNFWVKQELESEGIQFQKDVPQALADIFGEDLAAIAAEIQKLAVLDEVFSARRVAEIANRPASHDAFQLIEAISQAKKQEALAICQSLHNQGEDPIKILGALSWQYQIVAQAVAIRESRGKLDASTLAQSLRVKPFVAKKSLALSTRLNEHSLTQLLDKLLAADVAMKTGKDPMWQLQSLSLALCELYTRQSNA